MMEGVNSVKLYCKHICKCHNVPPYTTIVYKCKKKKKKCLVGHQAAQKSEILRNPSYSKCRDGRMEV
jgi:hypothetical protein